MAELNIHSLEDCTCGKNKNGNCNKCGKNNNTGDPANSGNYNIINIGNDIIESGNTITSKNMQVPFQNEKESVNHRPAKEIHTKEVIVQEREIPKIIEKVVPAEDMDSVLLMAQKNFEVPAMPVRVFKNGSYNLSLYKAFY